MAGRVGALVGVAFLTLLERKALGYLQTRKGPNKAGVDGVLQPVGDALKLLTNEPLTPRIRRAIVYYLSPMLSFSIILILWFTYPTAVGGTEMRLGLVFILCCLRGGVYPVLRGGWTSNSKYSLLGGLRAVAQTISYEVRLAIILLTFVLLGDSYDIRAFFIFSGQWLGLLCPPLVII